MTTFSTDIFTLAHVAITLIAIVAGVGVLFAMLEGKAPRALTGAFLLFTILTSVTGFLFFHPDHPTPAQATGILSLILLAAAVYAYYFARLAGGWRTVYVVTALAALYLNVFVLVIQLFLKLPALHALAPTGAGPVFGTAQGLVLLFFLGTGFLSLRRFHPRRP
jgi:hypothetical protein